MIAAVLYVIFASSCLSISCMEQTITKSFKREPFFLTVPEGYSASYSHFNHDWGFYRRYKDTFFNENHYIEIEKATRSFPFFQTTQDAAEKFKDYYYIQPNDTQNIYKLDYSCLKHSLTLYKMVHELETGNSADNPICIDVSDKLFRKIIEPILKELGRPCPQMRIHFFYNVDFKCSLKKAVRLITAANYLKIGLLYAQAFTHLPIAIKNSMKKSIKRTFKKLDQIPVEFIQESLNDAFAYISIIKPYTITQDNKRGIIHHHYPKLTIDQMLLFCALEEKDALLGKYSKLQEIYETLTQEQRDLLITEGT